VCDLRRLVGLELLPLTGGLDAANVFVDAWQRKVIGNNAEAAEMLPRTHPFEKLVPDHHRRGDEEHLAAEDSGFFATELELVLKSYGVQTLLIVGGLTDVCVHYTTVGAHQHDYHVRVATDAVLGSSQGAHDASLRAIEYLQRDALVTTARFDKPAREVVCEEAVA
jgi:nicotinamidase-related amidase